MLIVLNVAAVDPLITTVGRWLRKAKKTANIYTQASVSIQTSKSTIPPVDFLANFFLQSWTLLFGINDNSLLGQAYRAYQWTEDTKYNDQRRRAITEEFVTKIAKSVFLREDTPGKTVLYVAVSPQTATLWMELIQIVVQKEGRFYYNQDYTARGRHGSAKHRIHSPKLLTAFDQWFAENKHLQ